MSTGSTHTIQKLLYGLAEDELKKNRKADDLDDAYHGSLLKLIGKMKDPAGYQLQKIPGKKHFPAIQRCKALLKNNQATDVTALNKPGCRYRISHITLPGIERAEKALLISGKIFNNRHCHKAEPYNYASEDYGVKRLYL